MGHATAFALLVLGASGLGNETVPAGALESIREETLFEDVAYLASAGLEGRDTPSAGLERAAQHIEARLSAAGFGPWGTNEGHRFSFAVTVAVPVPESSRLVLARGATEREFAYGADFVPLPGANGTARGELVFAGFGIDASGERYNDLRVPLEKRIALFLEGEPRHPRRFDGPEVTRSADVYSKLADLAERGAVGAVIVRRPPASDGAQGLEQPRGNPAENPAEGNALAATELAADTPTEADLGFRSTWASWLGDAPAGYARAPIPAVEVSLATATALLGQDVAALAERIDAKAKPLRLDSDGRVVELSSASTRTEVDVDNVVMALPGSDPDLAAECVVLGAHYDHVGVDPRGRIGFGADDNGSGVAVMLEVAEALGTIEPRRTIVACAFAAEEDGLIGSRELCARLPVAQENLVAMINLDMVGRGDASEVAVVGTKQNPDLEDLVREANRLSKTGIRKLQMGTGHELFERSDHYSFHRIGVPAVFFFEGLPIARNPDYHTWRDSADKLDFDKMARTARLVFNTTWLLANRDERPGRPRR